MAPRRPASLTVTRRPDGILHVKTSGKLTPAEYEKFVPSYDALVKDRPGRHPMLTELHPSFSGWTIAGLWADLKFDVR